MGRKGKPGGAGLQIEFWSMILKENRNVFPISKFWIQTNSIQIQMIFKWIQKLEYSTIQKKLHGSMNSTNFWFDLEIY
jgi:hypothetical protein